MLRCAIRGAHGLYALYRKADLRCWLPALRSPLFIWHFRYNARRHAASTSMYVQLRHPWRTWPVRVIPKGELAVLASCSSQSFVYLALSIQRSQARSKYFHVCSAAPSLAHKASTRYTERPIYAAGFLLFAALCLSGTFDTTLAGTQQVLPCMFSCAIFGAQGQYALYRKADLRCWLPALRSPLFIWHFRYNARRHAASTSMYAQVRHPWRTWPVRVIPKGRFTLLASCSSQSFVYLALSIQRLQARSKYIHVCSGAPSLAHKACTRYTERRTCAAGSQLPAPSSQLPAPSSQLPAPSSRLSALGSRLSALGSRLSALGSRLSAPNSQPSIFQTIIHPRLNSRTQVLLFSYNQVQLSFKVPVRKL